ncbi:MAG: glutamate--tRNA ligase [Hyphomicrobiales bacterium]|nr:glutamate--tRNA ligase [Hyphomicrobiales bacterium]MDE2018445.1 glutamate--tRNA ligase [Hyphomicrobiales bacterium]
MTATPIVRFAPSPTGRIHIGNARTAMFNWLFARKNGGRFVLRFDDTDLARSREDYRLGIQADLEWLGIAPAPGDAFRQRDRFALYASAADRLRAAGRLYPAYETQAELERRRKLRQARGLPPLYDRAALRLTDAERAALEADGRRPHWRFKLEDRRVTWHDLVRGHCEIDCASLSDPILAREDGEWLYTLPSVVDDADMAITHVIRGEDHVANTAVQIQIFEALGAAPPAFAHHNLLADASGEGLSKRTGALSLASLRDEGIEPLAVAAMATLTGTSEAVRPVGSLDELAGLFDLSKTSRSAAKFDLRDLAALSARTLHATPYAAMAGRLAAVGIEGPRAEAFWLAVRGNLATFAEAAGWWSLVQGAGEPPVIEDAAFAAAAADALPSEPWSASTFGEWTAALKSSTGRKGRDLFHPLRLALTGRETGPELAPLLPLLGRERVRARLRAPSA